MTINVFDAFLRGDPQGFNLIYFTYRYPLMRFALALTDRIDVAEDAVSEAFRLLWERRGTFQSDLHIKRFLYKVTLNVCRTERRLLRRWFGLLPRSWDAIDPTTPELIAIKEMDAHNQWIINKIQEQLQHLPKQRAQDFHAYFFEQEKFKDIAYNRGVDDGVVRTNVALATKQIQNYLRDNAYPGLSKKS